VSSTSVGTVFVQGRGVGNATLTVQATGYTNATGDVTVNPSGFYFNTSSFSTTAAAANTTLDLRAARLDPITLNVVTIQPVRGGLTVDVAVTSSNTAVGTIVGSPASFASGTSSNFSVLFNPATAGSSTLTVQTPPGFSPPSNGREITATVNP
jgi:hypothetical protein